MNSLTLVGLTESEHRALSLAAFSVGIKPDVLAAYFIAEALEQIERNKPLDVILAEALDDPARHIDEEATRQ
jgi:hypothetical protein